MNEIAIVIAGAVMLDLILGDPRYLLHPVRLMGRSAAVLERMFRRIGTTGFFGGAALVVSMLCLTVGIYAAVWLIAERIHPGCALAVDIYAVYSCIALRDMIRHAQPIVSALRADDADAARNGVKLIVGRDTDALDAEGLARAAVESVAESLVDGFIAPLFWVTVVGGFALTFELSAFPFAVSAVVAYRCINTLDSIVGYRNERYICFGRLAAKLDDVLNFVPARLSLIPLWLGALVLRLDAQCGWRVALRDRLKHASPNSAHAESFVAGALGVRLGGPTQYPHGIVEKPWLGDGCNVVEYEHIRQTCSLTLAAGIITACFNIVIVGVI